jgi:hypothetical protein
MSMMGADLSESTLVQAYIAGDLSGAKLKGALMVYARLNQAVLSNADLTGASLFGASLVKTIFNDACLDDVIGPAFSDRCSGFTDALASATGKESQRLAEFAEGLEGLLTDQRRGST